LLFPKGCLWQKGLRLIATILPLVVLTLYTTDLVFPKGMPLAERIETPMIGISDEVFVNLYTTDLALKGLKRFRDILHWSKCPRALHDRPCF
jgi:hypothetical protein